MSQLKKSPFLVSAVALMAGAIFTAVAFSAPRPDAPEIVPAKKAAVKKAAVKSGKGKMVNGKLVMGTHQTVVVIRGKPKMTTPTGLMAYVIDEPNVNDGTVSVITEKNEFATIATGPGTRIARGYQLASISNLHPSYAIRCQGKWDQDGYQYHAASIAMGASVSDTDLTKKIAEACKNIKTARRSGGFGQSTVAMIPTAGLPKAVSVGGHPAPTPTPDATSPNTDVPKVTPPANPGKPLPIDPSMLPKPVNPAPPPAAPTLPTTPINPAPPTTPR